VPEVTTYVLVPGACHGGWWYQPLVDRLAAAGHAAVAVTPVGLDPDAAALERCVSLDDHVEQATAAMLATPADQDEQAADGRDVVLVGHSYGGSIISGVADRAPQRVRALVYLDAFVPENGDSAWSMTNDEERAWYIQDAGRTGVAVDPLPFFDPRARPHPLGTLVQRSKLTGAWRSVPAKHYIEATGWPGESPLAASTAKVSADPEFTVHQWATGTTSCTTARPPVRLHRRPLTRPLTGSGYGTELLVCIQPRLRRVRTGRPR